MTIKDINNKYKVTPKSYDNNLLNHFKVVFKNGAMPRNTDFNVTIELNDYYTFLWNNCEVIIVNAALWGDTVERTKINLTFDEEKIADTFISTYIVSQTNFQRQLVKEAVCTKNNSGKYEYQFDYNKKTSDAFFLIKIPKLQSN